VSRQPDFSTISRPNPLRTWERAALALAALALALVVLAAARARGEAAEANARLGETQGEVSRLAAQRAAMTRAATGGADASSSPARVVAAIAAALPPDARLERLVIDYKREIAIDMQVVTRSTSAWDVLLERLERSSQLRQVEPGPESRGGAVRSVVRARWKGSAR
jgi:hypothetical protein